MSNKSIEQLLEILRTNSLNLRHKRLHSEFAYEAHRLFELDQNKAFWEKNPVPKAPVAAKLNFEGIRASLTFVLPVAVMASVVVMSPGIVPAAIAAPFALLAGYINHKKYKKDIQNVRQLVDKFDSRYEFFKKFEDLFNSNPENFTYDFVSYQAKSYAKFKKEFDQFLMSDLDLELTALRQLPDLEDRIRVQNHFKQINLEKEAKERKQKNKEESRRARASLEQQGYEVDQHGEVLNPTQPAMNIDGAPMTLGLPYGVPLDLINGGINNNNNNSNFNSNGSFQSSFNSGGAGGLF